MSAYNEGLERIDVEKVVATATAWRENEGEGDSCQAGVVLVFQGVAYGWKNALRDPQHERPGSIAVDMAGNLWVASGGDDENGAKVWRPV